MDDLKAPFREFEERNPYRNAWESFVAGYEYANRNKHSSTEITLTDCTTKNLGAHADPKRVTSTQNTETVPMHDREGNYIGEWNGKIESGAQYISGVERYKNEFEIPPGTKLGKRPSKTTAK